MPVTAVTARNVPMPQRRTAAGAAEPLTVGVRGPVERRCHRNGSHIPGSGAPGAYSGARPTAGWLMGGKRGPTMASTVVTLQSGGRNANLATPLKRETGLWGRQATLIARWRATTPSNWVLWPPTDERARDERAIARLAGRQRGIVTAQPLQAGRAPGDPHHQRIAGEQPQGGIGGGAEARTRGPVLVLAQHHQITSVTAGMGGNLRRGFADQHPWSAVREPAVSHKRST